MSKRQTAESACQLCQEPILFAQNSANGSGIVPLDLRPEKITGRSQGPFYILNDLTMVCTRMDTAMIELAIEKERRVFTNHLVTCEKRERNAA